MITPIKQIIRELDSPPAIRRKSSKEVFDNDMNIIIKLMKNFSLSSTKHVNRKLAF